MVDVSLMDIVINGEKLMISNGSVKVFGKFGEKEKLDINCVVKEYLMVVGYKIFVMIF